MNDKMTSGEIARQAGVSQKAIRVYDEKGLLKPVGYSEGNYKLYDKNSLMILEKIIALKHVGFSLEEIKSNLESDEPESIEETLKKQLALMEDKIYEMQRAAKCIKAAIARLHEDPDWDNIADIIKKMEMEHGADDRRAYAVKHAADGIEWYVKIYDSLDFKKDENVLDLGCCYGELWRQNWERIPENFNVDGYDVHESWAEDFEKYVEEEKSKLPQSSDVKVLYGNLEKDETWEEIHKNKYDRIIAHYFMTYINDTDYIMENAARVLKDDGMFSVNFYGISCEFDFWENIFDELSMDKSFAIKKKKDLKQKQEAFQELIKKHFSRFEIVQLPCSLNFDDSEILFEKLLSRYPNGNKVLMANKDKLMEYFDRRIEKEGFIVVEMDSAFYHCYK